MSIYETFLAFLFFLPFFGGCVAYFLKFSWVFLLRRSFCPFFDEAPMRWWFSIATGVALVGFVIFPRPYSYEEGVEVSLLLFFVMFAWGLPLFFWREFIRAFWWGSRTQVGRAAHGLL